MPQRGVAFRNVFNFRDLGGYRTIDGRTVAWQRLYRSDDLCRLHDSEREQLRALGIRTVIDLRRPHEIAELGRIPDIDGITYQHVHMAHPLWPSADFPDTAARTSYVIERYREMSIEAADGIGEALRLIADPAAAPLVFHCIAGKDRTGLVSALILALLGVPDDVIAEDYTLSEVAEPATWAYFTRDRPDKAPDRWKHIVVSPPEAMLAFLEDLRARHGSITGYAKSVGVTDDHLDSLRAHLLTPSPRSR